MIKSFELVIKQLNNQEIRQKAQESLNVVVKSKPQFYLEQIIDGIYQDNVNIPYIELVSNIDTALLTKEFSVVITYWISKELKSIREQKMIKQYEQLVINIPHYSGQFAIFCDKQEFSTEKEAKLFYKISFPKPTPLQTVEQLKFCVSVSTIDDVAFLFKEAIDLFLRNMNDESLMIVIVSIMIFLIRKYKKCVVMKTIIEEIMTHFYLNFEEKLTQLLYELKYKIDNVNNLLEVLICIFYTEMLKYLPIRYYSNVHSQFLLLTIRVIVDYYQSGQSFTLYLKDYSDVILESPILVKCLSYDENQEDCLVCIIISLVHTIETLITYEPIVENNYILGFTASTEAQQLIETKHDKELLFLSASEVSTFINGLLNEFIIELKKPQSQEVLVEELSLSLVNVAIFQTQPLIEELQNEFQIVKNEHYYLQLLNYLIMEMTKQGFIKEYEEVLKFIIQNVNYVLYEQLKLPRSKYEQFAQFEQLSIEQLLYNEDFKITIEESLIKLLISIVRANNYCKMHISNSIIYDYIEVIVDSYCHLFSSSTSFSCNNSLLKMMVNNDASIKKMLIEVVINTLFKRQFRILNQQTDEAYNYQVRLYYGCYSIISFVAHEDYDEYLFISILNDESIEFIDYLSLCIMNLLCISVEEQHELSVISLREMVISALNYVTQLQLDEEHEQAIETFFGTRVQAFGKIHSCIHNYSQKNRYLIDVQIDVTKQFIEKILRLFAFKQEKFSIVINFNDFFPGYKWRSYNEEVELFYNLSGAKNSNNSDFSTPSEMSVSGSTNEFTEESEMDNYKQLMLNFNIEQKLQTKADEYIYAVFEYVYEILSLVSTEQSYRFYQDCYNSMLIQGTNVFLQRQFEYRVSIMGLIRKLEGITFDYEELCENGNEMTIENTKIITEFTDIITNCYKMMDKKLKITDAMFLIEGISEASLQTFLVLLNALMKSEQLSPKECLQMFQIATKNPCMMDVFSDVKKRSTKTSEKLFNAETQQNATLISVLVEYFNAFKPLKAYKLLCYSAFNILNLKYEKAQYNERDVGEDSEVLDIITYLLQSSCFSNIELLTTNYALILGERELEILNTDGTKVLEAYLSKSDVVDHYSYYEFNEEYALFLRESSLFIIEQSEFDLAGSVSQCIFLWLETIDSFIVYCQTFEINDKNIMIIILKAFTIFSFMLAHPEIQPMYQCQILPRLITLLMSCFEQNPTDRFLHYIIDVFIYELYNCKNIDIIPFVLELLAQCVALCSYVLNAGKQLTTVLIQKKAEFRNNVSFSEQIVKLLCFDNHQAAFLLLELLTKQSISLDGNESNIGQLSDLLLKYTSSKTETINVVLEMINQDERYYNSLLPIIAILLQKIEPVLLTSKQYALLIIARVMRKYQTIDIIRHKQYIETFSSLFQWCPDIMLANLLLLGQSNQILLDEFINNLFGTKNIKEYVSAFLVLIISNLEEVIYCYEQCQAYNEELIKIYIKLLLCLFQQQIIKDELLDKTECKNKLTYLCMLLLIREIILPNTNAELLRVTPFALVSTLLTNLLDITDQRSSLLFSQLLQQIESCTHEDVILDLTLELFQLLVLQEILSIEYFENYIIVAYSHELTSNNINTLLLCHCFATAAQVLNESSPQNVSRLVLFQELEDSPFILIYQEIILNVLSIKFIGPDKKVNEEQYSIININFKQDFEIDEFLLRMYNADVKRFLLAAIMQVAELNNLEQFVNMSMNIILHNEEEYMLQAFELLCEIAKTDAKQVYSKIQDNIFQILTNCQKIPTEMLFEQLVIKLTNNSDFGQAIAFFIKEKCLQEEIVNKITCKSQSLCFRMNILFYLCKYKACSTDAGLQAICDVIQYNRLDVQELQQILDFWSQISSL